VLFFFCRAAGVTICLPLCTFDIANGKKTMLLSPRSLNLGVLKYKSDCSRTFTQFLNPKHSYPSDILKSPKFWFEPRGGENIKDSRLGGFQVDHPQSAKGGLRWGLWSLHLATKMDLPFGNRNRIVYLPNTSSRRTDRLLVKNNTTRCHQNSSTLNVLLQGAIRKPPL